MLAVTSNRSTLRRKYYGTVWYRNTIAFFRSVLWLLVVANVVPNSPVFLTLVMEAIHFSESSVLARATRRYNPEDGILHSHRRENLKSYIALTGWGL
jgi:hypothetical protein